METLIKCLEIKGIPFVSIYAGLKEVIFASVLTMLACAILAIAVAVDKREHKKLTCFGISMIAMAVLFISSSTYATIIDMHTVRKVKFTCSDQQYLELAKTGYNLEPTDNPNEYICTGRHS